MKSSTQCTHYIKYIGHNEGKKSKNYSAYLPFAHPLDKSKSHSPLFDDPETLRTVAPARMSVFPTA